MTETATQTHVLMIDHLLIGTPDLELGCQYIFEQWGVEPIVGGAHPGIGTCNALLGLENDIYIEIIAPDPQQSTDLPMGRYLRGLEQTALMWWAIRCNDFSAQSKRLQQHNVAVLSQGPGKRRLPDGRVLQWQSMVPDGPEFQCALPFFIDWKDMNLHPSRNLPTCGTLNSMQVSHPAMDKLRGILGPCYRDGDHAGRELRAELNVNRKIVTLTTPEDFPPGVGSFYGS